MEKEFQKKLFDFTTTPPPGVWEVISIALDESSNDLSFPTKLQQFQATPPPATWEKIEQQLSSAPARVVPFKLRNLRKTRQIAAAAVFIIAAASIVFWNMDDVLPAHSNSEQITFPSTTVNSSAPINPPEPPSSSRADNNVEQVENNHGTATASSRQITGVQNIPTGGKASKTVSSFKPEVTSASLLKLGSILPKKAQPKETAVSSVPFDRYMVYSDEDGDAMRVSKKLFNFLICVKEELLCQQEKKQLEQRFASYTNANDFGGLIDLLKNLRENQ